MGFLFSGGAIAPCTLPRNGNALQAHTQVLLRILQPVTEEFADGVEVHPSHDKLGRKVVAHVAPAKVHDFGRHG